MEIIMTSLTKLETLIDGQPLRITLENLIIICKRRATYFKENQRDHDLAQVCAAQAKELEDTMTRLITKGCI